jgi:hypothetical protein
VRTRSPSFRALTGGVGADAAIEAVGVPATFELVASLIRPGGHVANSPALSVRRTAATNCVDQPGMNTQLVQ